ncbi:MAG: hypothetical protein H6842_02595 [Rhodospirillaceae bacterium]|nr:hypothetical protein [Rhodospirillaceae bacterium]
MDDRTHPTSETDHGNGELGTPTSDVVRTAEVQVAQAATEPEPAAPDDLPISTGAPAESGGEAATEAGAEPAAATAPVEAAPAAAEPVAEAAVELPQTLLDTLAELNIAPQEFLDQAIDAGVIPAEADLSDPAIVALLTAFAEEIASIEPATDAEVEAEVAAASGVLPPEFEPALDDFGITVEEFILQAIETGVIPEDADLNDPQVIALLRDLAEQLTGEVLEPAAGPGAPGQPAGPAVADASSGFTFAPPDLDGPPTPFGLTDLLGFTELQFGLLPVDTFVDDFEIFTPLAGGGGGFIPPGAFINIGPSTGRHFIREDSGPTDPNNTISISAGVTGGPGGLTDIQFVIFQPTGAGTNSIGLAVADPASGVTNVDDFVFDFSGLEQPGWVLTIGPVVVGPDGETLTVTLTYTGSDYPATYNGTYVVVPPADSDVDLGTMTVTANVVSSVDPTVTASATGSVRTAGRCGAGCDAGDQQPAGVLIPESASEQTVDLNLNFQLVVAPFGQPLPVDSDFVSGPTRTRPTDHRADRHGQRRRSPSACDHQRHLHLDSTVIRSTARRRRST